MIRIAAGLFAALSIVSAAQAAEMRPMQATGISLGEVSGVVYYTVADDGYRVVATLAAGENGTPVRFVTTLAAGQRMLVSVPKAADEPPLELELARLGDSVIVSGPAALVN
jgi:predicted aconitase